MHDVCEKRMKKASYLLMYKQGIFCEKSNINADTACLFSFIYRNNIISISCSMHGKYKNSTKSSIFISEKKKLNLGMHGYQFKLFFWIVTKYYLKMAFSNVKKKNKIRIVMMSSLFAPPA